MRVEPRYSSTNERVSVYASVYCVTSKEVINTYEDNKYNEWRVDWSGHDQVYLLTKAAVVCCRGSEAPTGPAVKYFHEIFSKKTKQSWPSSEQDQCLSSTVPPLRDPPRRPPLRPEREKNEIFSENNEIFPN